MFRVDFKISRLTQWGTSTHAAINFYKGEVKARLEHGTWITRYGDRVLLEKVFLNYPGVKTEKQIVKEMQRRLRTIRPGIRPIKEQRNAEDF
tara:strand:+ start:1270 stop:1545 length:276 start_codon:yes stop_codon:yes gene_type:complete